MSAPVHQHEGPSTGKGRAPDYQDHAGSEATNGNNTNVGFKSHGGMTVKPPTKDDLQRSYATIVENDASPKGWYGTMGTCRVMPV